MCIICYKPKGAPLPSMKTLKYCWDKNPHGTGIALIRPDNKDNVIVNKGQMDWKTFQEVVLSYNIQEDDIAVYHFRLATSGGISPQKTHPFPVSKKVIELNRAGEWQAKHVFIHNGVLHSGSKELSDTQMYVRDILHGIVKANVNRPTLKRVIAETTIGSRTLLLNTAQKYILLTGQWHKYKDCFFSKSDYKPPVSPFTSIRALTSVEKCKEKFAYNLLDDQDENTDDFYDDSWGGFSYKYED